ncbi:hypothetical protein [Agrobacterium radiobacter]|uniref:hypothetical protein n=1 Tax=Agrobacterium radiobacter TaxID=362 RepID=UPI003CE45E63
MFTSKPIEASRYYDIDAQGNVVIVPVPDAEQRTVHAEWVYGPDERTIPFLWGMAKGEARRRAEPQPHTHNILFNIRPRPRDPVMPLAGTVFDPRRYRRP